MTNDSSLVSEIWDLVKSHVHKDDYLEVCDQLVEIFDTHNMSDGFEDEVGFESNLQHAIRSYYGVEDDEDDDMAGWG